MSFFYISGSSCGLPLGLSTGEVGAVQLTASSYSGHNFPHQARLNTPGVWCADPNDTQPYLQVPFVNAVVTSYNHHHEKKTFTCYFDTILVY